MEEKKINYGLIVGLLIIFILFIPIIIDYIKSQKIETLLGDEISEKIALKENFLVYVGDMSKDIKKDLKSIRNIKTNDYSLAYNVYNVDNNKETEKLFGKEVNAVLIINGDIQQEYKDYKYKEVYSDVEEFIVGNIREDNASYKVAENFKEFKNLVKSKDVNMFVFGRVSCPHCNNYKVVYNALADKYNVDIYYFDSDTYNIEQYKKVVSMDLDVPAKCSTTGQNFKLSDGFGTPLTIFTKKGKVVDCISGYVDRTVLANKLKENKMISE